ncbi:hypothetical protein BDN72DRAFT_962971 [Pluteus cervinus]|uniref:Uncharacterized protein n=1 Tax=Pluteus cervinus TaxID=181527 RepID=A0ACD3AGI8_9AGAR|nr:hypothetical protein BDN72DRAFT_962971 [Pluteus cervinus]
MSTDSETLFAAKVEELTALEKDLPDVIALARTDDWIFQVFESVPVRTDLAKIWTVFNHRVDIPFGNDLCDLNGRLGHIRRVEYLNDIAMGQGLLWDLALLKVEWLKGFRS